eukprot:TRINITY_DN22508_c0_g1_i1.p1 TRINITY_DN22508_c0_g1~~TRINITY_DN22508_c0_g1_i1.p1  ORF type:complete len:4404 (-),score=1151.18 TRINITY_DN22508_c0_g1_i1:37-13248(-)
MNSPSRSSFFGGRRSPPSSPSRSFFGGPRPPAGFGGGPPAGYGGGPFGACPTCNENAAALRADLDALQRERTEMFAQNQQLMMREQMNQQQLQALGEQLRAAEAQQHELMQLRDSQSRLLGASKDKDKMAADYQAQLSLAESGRQDLAAKVRIAERERDEYFDEVKRLRQELETTSQDRGEHVKSRHEHAKELNKFQEEETRYRQECERLKAEIKKMQGDAFRIDEENNKFRDRVVELEQILDETERDAQEYQAINGHLQRRIDEMEVQIAAQSKYEQEFDHRVTKMLDERDKALAEGAKEKEAMLLKVRELQEELGIARRAGGSVDAADATELAMLLKDKQLEVEDLEDRSEELEQELGRLREELEGLRRGRPPPPPTSGSGSAAADGGVALNRDEMERQVQALKAEAFDKDARLLDIEKKLMEFARGIGAEAIVAENRKLMRQHDDMKRQVGEAKRDLSNYLSEAASIVYENDLLRSIANVKPEQFNLQEFKLKEKVTSAKAVAMQRQLEKEVADLEEERSKLKARARQMAELAAEKISLLHDLQPEQMLQLEEIAASMRKGKLELPLTDESRKLKSERDELKKQLSDKDRELADHVDKKVNELLAKQGATKDFEVKISALEHENNALKSSLEAIQAAQVEQIAASVLASEGAQGFAAPDLVEQLQQSLQLQAQVQAQLQQLQAGRPGAEKAVGPSIPPTPMAGLLGGTLRGTMNKLSLPPTPAGRPGAGTLNMSGLLNMPKANLGGTLGGFGGGLPHHGMPAVLPKIPGMQQTAWSSLLQAAISLPRELGEGTPEAMCSLYCQVIETMEELARERQLRTNLGEEIELFQQKYDRLLAEQEILYKDYFRQRDAWSIEKRMLEERLKAQGDQLTDNQRKFEVQEDQTKQLQRLAGGAAGASEADLRSELVSAMARIAALEQNESILSRKYDAAKDDHSMVKHAFDNLEKDFCERERYLKERLSKALLWKRRSATALRIARRRMQSMVVGTDFERSQQELQVSRQRELDLARRQTELTLTVAQKEDKLREMADLRDRCSSLDNLVRETEQEFTVLRRRLQAREPRFAAECSLFARLTADLQRALGFVGHFEAASRAIAAAESDSVVGSAVGVPPPPPPTGSVELGIPINVEASLEDKLRKIDTNNDGFITLGELAQFFRSLEARISDEDMKLMADALHPTAPLLHEAPAPPPPPGPPAPFGVPAPPPAPPTSAEVAALSQASVSLLGVLGRFRLFGLRPLEPEELFWAAVQAQLLRRPEQPDAQQVLRTSFQLLRSHDGYISAGDVVRVFGGYEVPVERMPCRSLRRVLTWLGVDVRMMEQEAPATWIPLPGDPREPEYRSKLLKLRLVYHDFAERFERCSTRALLQLRPPEAGVPGMLGEPHLAAPDAAVQVQVAKARESASNRRCVVLEQEVRTKVRTVHELQRQIGELETLVQRLEAELHEERSSRVGLQGQLDGMLPKTEVEPKLRQLEELRFEVQQSRLALQQAKDMARVCSSQAESYEQLIKRRQQEVRHLQESVKLLQATDEVSNTVGKLQYRLLLSQWEKGNVQRQLQAATQDLRQARRELLETEDQSEQDRRDREAEEESLQQRLASAKEAAAKFKEQATASLPIDKARELTSRLEEIASRKTELEDKLAEVRRQLHRNLSETEECKMRAQQAQELMAEMKALDTDSEAPRQRLLEMARKLADARLLELRHKRDLDMAKEEHQHLQKARQADEKEIETLQKEVSKAEAKLADQEERYRDKILEARGFALQSGAAADAQGGGPSPPRLRKASKTTIEGMEQLQQKVLERDAKIAALEQDLDKTKADRESAIAEERMKVRKLELELNLVNQGDTVKLRQALRAEHDAQIKQISEAAQESVATLQALLDQADVRVRQRGEEIEKLNQLKREQSERYSQEALQLQSEISQLRQQLVLERHQHPHGDTGARMTPLGAASIDMNDSFRLGESMGSTQAGQMFGSVEARLGEKGEQVLALQARLEAQQDEFQALLDQQHAEGVQREERLHQEYQAREERVVADIVAEYDAAKQHRDMELETIKRELEAVRQSAAMGSDSANAMFQQQVQEAQKHADIALQHNAVAEQNRQSAEEWRARAQQLEEELEIERENHEKQKAATVAATQEAATKKEKHQAHLRKQLASKEEQLSSFKRAVEDLKERVVHLTMKNEREEQDAAHARRAETEMKRRIVGQEEKMHSLRDQVARLTKQLDERKAEVRHETARCSEQESQERELERLLEEASLRLAEQQTQIRQLEDDARRQLRRADEAEDALAAEQKALDGETKAGQRDSKEAAEANARRVAALRDRIEVLEVERNELLAKLGGLEKTLANLRCSSSGGMSPDPQVEVAEMKERLRLEQELRLSLQEEVRELSVQLEMVSANRQDQAALSESLQIKLKQQLAKKPQPRLSLSPRQDRSLVPSAHSGSPSASRGGSRSPAPRSLKQAGELATRCGQLQAELAAIRARASKLEQENDDLKLRLASDADGTGAMGTSALEVDILRSSLDSVSARNKSLAAEVEAERFKNRMASSVGNIGAVHQQLEQVLQQLNAERERSGLLSQALEVERRVNAGADVSASGNSVALATARATIANLQQRLDDMIREQVHMQELLHEKQQPSTAGSGYAMPPPPPRESPEPRRIADAAQVDHLQRRIEELTRENIELMRRAAMPPVAHADPVALAAAKKQVVELQARLEQLQRENVQLQRAAGQAFQASPITDSVSLAASQQQVIQLQARLDQLLHENVELQRNTAGIGGDSAALAAARRHNEDLQVKLQGLLNENAQLQREKAAAEAPPAVRPGVIGMGSPGTAEDLAELRRLHGEASSQRRLIGILLSQAANPDKMSGSEAGLATFELLAEECQRLYQKVTATSDENAVLRSRLPQADAGGTNGLPPMVPPLPGSLAELKEANAVLRARFDALASELSLGITWKEEAAKRIGQLATEVEELKQRLAISGTSAETQALMDAHRSLPQDLEARLERSEKDRNALNALLAGQTARVAELSADLEEMEQRLRELVLGKSGVISAGVQPASQALVRERVRLEHQERLASELRQAQEEANRAARETLEARAEQEGLKVSVQRLTAQNAELTREIEQLRILAESASAEAAVPGMEEVANRFAKRAEELSEENAQLRKALERSVPEQRQSVLEAAKRSLEESGVTFLQILRALDGERSGQLPLRTIEAALKKLPLQLAASTRLPTVLWETACKFKAASGDISYVDWVAHLTTLPTLTPGEADLTLGTVDALRRLKGFSLRAALEAVDLDGDGLLTATALLNAFKAFFEFLLPEELPLLLELLRPSDSSDGPIEQIALMDCAWKLDLAFIASQDQINALQAKRRQCRDLALGRPLLPGGPTWNPLKALEDLAVRREESGEKGALRHIVNIYDCDRSGMVTKPMFKAIIRDQVQGENLDEEQLDYMFEALDQDGDGAIIYHEFEKAVMGADHQRRFTDMLLRMAQALGLAGARLENLAQVTSGAERPTELTRQQLSQIFMRIGYRASDQDLDILLGELDANGHGTICLAELQFRIEAARVDVILGECKAVLAGVGVKGLLQAFDEADTEQCGRLNYAQLEGLLLGRLQLDISKANLRELFNIFDLDDSGRISYRELLQRCGLAQKADDRGDRHCLSAADGPRWGEQAMAAVKRALLRAKRDEESLPQAARRLLMEHDQRGAGVLTTVQLRRAFSSIGLDMGPREAEKLCELLRPAIRDAAQRGARRGSQQGQQRGGPRLLEKEMRLEMLLAKLQTIHVPEEESIQQRVHARPAAKALRAGLARRGLSLMALLTDLDPGMHGKVLFDAFRISAVRHRLGLEDDDFARLASAVGVDSRGLFATEQLLHLLQSSEEATAAEPEVSSPTKDRTSMARAAVGGGEALEGLPPPERSRSAASLSSQRRGRSTGGLQAGAGSRALEGAVEARHRGQFEMLQSALLKSEEDRTRLEKELESLRHEVAVQAEEYNKPRPLTVLLSAGDRAPSIVKELKLEVKGTRELRDKLFYAESELETLKRRLEVDARQELEKERHTVNALRAELEEKERSMADLIFDLRRARAAAGDGDWAQKEEEYMRLNLQNRRLEEEIAGKRRSEHELSERILDQEHQLMELRFEREQVQSRSARLESRILELELMAGDADSGSPSRNHKTFGPAAATASVSSRKERNLEHVIESLERVISQQKTENQRLRNDLDAKRPDERKTRAEADKLRRRVGELEAELGKIGSRRGQSLVQDGKRGQGSRSEALQAAEDELEEQRIRIAQLEKQLMQAPLEHRKEDASSEESKEVQRLREELKELQHNRSMDAVALDEAQRALHEAELTEQRYLEVARENKRLRQDLGALEDEGFWQEIEQLQAKQQEAITLTRESKQALERLSAFAPSADPPMVLIERLGRFLTEQG